MRSIPDMVLIPGKSPKGAEKIASRCAKNRNVLQIGFALDRMKHGRAVPFRRNDEC
jgi:SLOG family YspA-like protein